MEGAIKPFLLLYMRDTFSPGHRYRSHETVAGQLALDEMWRILLQIDVALLHITHGILLGQIRLRQRNQYHCADNQVQNNGLFRIALEPVRF